MHDVVIIGSGFSGIGMAVRLRQAGIEDFVVLERADGVGGTWHYNTYPGCGCDVPSHLYSFSFAPNPDWSRTYSKQPEIRAYLERVVDDFGVREKLRLGCAVRSAAWEDGHWRVETSQGTVTGRFLVSGTGPLVEPKLPADVSRFQGPAFHSARWDHSVDLRGKRVAAIGTGASAIQFVPAIAPEVERLHVVQRTAPWVVPHSARPIRAWERALFRRVPPAQRMLRGAIYATRELLVLGFVKRPPLLRVLERAANKHREHGLNGDPDLVARTAPNFRLGCKRILPSNDWYPALARENVELLDAALTEVRERSIVLADGTEREVDVLVFGTGFHVVDMPIAELVRGRGGRTLADVWQGSPHAHLGSTVPGFPNLFLLLGPNTGLGHSSMVYMIESQIAYVIDALRTGADVIEVRPEAEARSRADVQKRMRGTIWNSGCKSWYMDAQGNNPTLWPDWTWRFRQRTAKFDAREYACA